MFKKSPRKGSSGGDALIRWSQKWAGGYPGVSISNFTHSWRDGLALLALFNSYKPGVIDFYSRKAETYDEMFENHELAFNLWKEHFKVEPLLDAEDMLIGPTPDRRSQMTYLSQIYKTLKDNGISGVKNPHEADYLRQQGEERMRKKQEEADARQRGKSPRLAKQPVQLQSSKFTASNDELERAKNCGTCGQCVRESKYPECKSFVPGAFRKAQCATCYHTAAQHLIEVKRSGGDSSTTAVSVPDAKPITSIKMPETTSKKTSTPASTKSYASVDDPLAYDEPARVRRRNNRKSRRREILRDNAALLPREEESMESQLKRLKAAHVKARRSRPKRDPMVSKDDAGKLAAEQTRKEGWSQTSTVDASAVAARRQREEREQQEAEEKRQREREAREEKERKEREADEEQRQRHAEAERRQQEEEEAERKRKEAEREAAKREEEEEREKKEAERKAKEDDDRRKREEDEEAERKAREEDEQRAREEEEALKRKADAIAKAEAKRKQEEEEQQQQERERQKKADDDDEEAEKQRAADKPAAAGRSTTATKPDSEPDPRKDPDAYVAWLGGRTDLSAAEERAKRSAERVIKRREEDAAFEREMEERKKAREERKREREKRAAQLTE